MDQEELNNIVEEQGKWLWDEGGWRADLRWADLHGANLREANMHKANLHGADLRGADLREADLHRADLYGANLHGADLRWANLHGADLRDADLRGADLCWADLRWANLYKADLRGADLREANDAPLQMQVGPWTVYIQSGYMRIGCKRHRVEDWRSFDDDTIHRMDPVRALEFWWANREWLLAACDAQMATIKE
jgi:hypothetical protein